MKRLLDCTASDFLNMTGQDLKQSIKASEGRTMLAETMATVPPLYPDVTNAELTASFGADLLLFNVFDVFNPEVMGFTPSNPEQVIHEIKHLTGRPVGLNLEPVDLNAEKIETLDQIDRGRIASDEALAQAKSLGFDFICLTGNPKTGVTNVEITNAIQRARRTFGSDALIIAGKMHGAGVTSETGSGIISESALDAFIDAGADVILMPSPGTVPGITTEDAQKYVSYVHSKSALAMLTIGTSQEGADESTIRQIALAAKMAGADIHHIGDAGFYGIAVPENIMTYSTTIRGRRHTYVRMARSINR